MNNKLLALILFFSVTIFNFNNCADKAKEEAQAMPLFGPGSLAKLVEEFKEIKEYAQKIEKFDPNFKQFKERALKLFDKFNNEALKQKVGSVKHYREFLIQAGLYPKDKIDLEGQSAIKAYEDALESQFYNVLKSYFAKIAISGALARYIPELIQIFPIKISNKELKISDIFTNKQVVVFIAEVSKLSSDQIVQFLVLAFGEDLNKPVLEQDFRDHKRQVPLLIALAWEYDEGLEKLKNEQTYAPKAENLVKLANIIKALLRSPEVDVAAKDSRGYNFADYANQKDEKGAYTRPELHAIYEEHMVYVNQRRDALKGALENELPVFELRDLGAGYVN